MHKLFAWGVGLVLVLVGCCALAMGLHFRRVNHFKDEVRRAFADSPSDVRLIQQVGSPAAFSGRK